MFARERARPSRDARATPRREARTTRGPSTGRTLSVRSRADGRKGARMSEPKIPLAFDANGNPLEVPAGAVAWRVRRGGGRRGRPRTVFDGETGRQLEVALSSTIEDLIDHGCPPGRYRLEAVDASGRV